MEIVLPLSPPGARPIGVIQDTDPGAIGAGMVWVDTTLTPGVLRYRNDTNTGWDGIGATASVLEFPVSPPSTMWTLVHNLGRPPASVTAFDATGAAVVFELTAPDTSTAVLRFNVPVAGTAFVV